VNTRVLARLVGLLFLALPLTLFGQAGIEYALKTGSSVAAPGGSAIAGCPVDSALLSCLGHAYPRAAIVGGIVVLSLILRWLAGSAAFRAR